ncbi:MAG: hypothetical protein EXR50_06855 [Dehalococcoidia bacterium]|nr:hypothetical protein [Dehalococcoidia bacterium]
MNASLIGKIEKAKRYAEEPKRVSFREFSVVFSGENDDHIVSFKSDEWNCSCDFFTGWKVCSHTMALERILLDMLPREAFSPHVTA